MSQLTTDMFRLSLSQSGPFLIHDLSPVCNKSNTTDDKCGAGTGYLSRAPEFTPWILAGFVFLDLYISA